MMAVIASLLVLRMALRDSEAKPNPGGNQHD
jgi:hypothetical protein